MSEWSYAQCSEDALSQESTNTVDYIIQDITPEESGPEISPPTSPPLLRPHCHNHPLTITTRPHPPSHRCDTSPALMEVSLQEEEVASSRETSPFEEIRLEEAVKKEVHIVVVGRSGAGKSTLLKNVLGLDTDTEMSASSKTKAFKTYTTTRNGVTIHITDTVGLRTKRKKQCLKKLSKHVQGEADLVIYCLPVGPGSRFDNANPSIMKSLQDAFGKDIWKHCMVALTFSNLAWDRICSDHAHQDAAVARYKQHIAEHVDMFRRELDTLKVDGVEVRSMLELESGVLEGADGHTTLCIPAGYMPEDTVLPGLQHTARHGDTSAANAVENRPATPPATTIPQESPDFHVWPYNHLLQAWSNDTRARSCDLLQVRSHDHQAQSCDPQTWSHDHRAQSCDLQTRSHDHRAQSCDSQTQSHDLQAESHDQEAEVTEEEGVTTWPEVLVLEVIRKSRQECDMALLQFWYGQKRLRDTLRRHGIEIGMGGGVAGGVAGGVVGGGVGAVLGVAGGPMGVPVGVAMGLILGVVAGTLVSGGSSAGIATLVSHTLGKTQSKNTTTSQ